MAHVQRKRLTLEQWWAILRYSIEHQPPWVSRMLALAIITGQRRSDLVKMRFDDVWDGHLHVEQVKTGTRIALPLVLRLGAIDLTLSRSSTTVRSITLQVQVQVQEASYFASTTAASCAMRLCLLGLKKPVKERWETSGRIRPLCTRVARSQNAYTEHKVSTP